MVQAPNSLMMIRNGLHSLTRKLVTEVLFSSLATVLTMAILSHVTKPTPPIARDSGLQTSSDGNVASGETSEALADFMERAALAHVAGLTAPTLTASQATIVAMNGAAPAAAIPLPPRPATAPRHGRLRFNKVHVAARVPKILPPVQPPMAIAEPAAVAAPVKTEPLPPLEFGMHLVSNLGNIITTSETRVAESVASVGDTLNSFVKTPFVKKL